MHTAPKYVFKHVVQTNQYHKHVFFHQLVHLKNRLVLQENLDAAKATYVDEEKPERPLHWGGYAIKPFRIEFWQGQKSRLHDRIIFEKKSGDWSKKRLAP